MTSAGLAMPRPVCFGLSVSAVGMLWPERAVPVGERGLAPQRLQGGRAGVAWAAWAQRGGKRSNAARRPYAWSFANLSAMATAPRLARVARSAAATTGLASAGHRAAGPQHQPAAVAVRRRMPVVVSLPAVRTPQWLRVSRPPAASTHGEPHPARPRATCAARARPGPGRRQRACR